MGAINQTQQGSSWRDTDRLRMRETTIESHFVSTTVSRPMEHHTPTLASPPDTTTSPPGAIGKRTHSKTDTIRYREREGSETIDAAVLSAKLKEFKEDARSREVTPGGSPSRKRPRLYADRSVKKTAYLRYNHYFFYDLGKKGDDIMCNEQCADISGSTGSFQSAADKTYRPTLVFFPMKCLQALLRDQSGARRMESCTFREVRLEASLVVNGGS